MAGELKYFCSLFVISEMEKKSLPIRFGIGDEPESRI